MSMKPRAPFHPRGRMLPAAVAAALAFTSLLPAPAVFAQAGARARSEAVTLNFVNAEIEGVARAMSAILAGQADPSVLLHGAAGKRRLLADSPVG